jgi:hypothetical protein
MGSGIGKMFGIDKIFGGFLDSIGLGALKPLVNVAFDFATGNIPGMIQDLGSLMSSFGKGDFTNNVSTRQPLPDSFNNSNQVGDDYGSDRAENEPNSCCRDDNGDLSSNRISQFFKLLSEIFSSKDSSEQMSKLSDLFKLLSENANNRDIIQNNRTSVGFFSSGVEISA